MKLIYNEEGYATSIFLLILLIPLVLLMIIIVEEYAHEVDNTIETIESEKIKSNTEDFENELITITKESLNEVTLDVVNSKQPLTDSRRYLKEYIGRKILKNERKYQKDNIYINTEIKSIESSNDPFKIEINYHITSRINDSNIKISKEEKKLIELTDNNHPIYDPLPVLKTGALFNNDKVYYQNRLTDYIELDNNTVYLNVVTPIIIKKCPYDEYRQHGNSNQTFLNCIHNHYYHNSHDGMCLLCRLENKTACNHYGFETFIIPTKECDKAPASIDHVLLNDKSNQYDGNKIILNNQTLIYLDDGHKSKYGL